MRLLKVDGQRRARIVEAEPPQPGPGQVVVRTGMSAVCGSELKTYRGEGVAAGNMGHEAMGQVVRCGQGVTRVKVGQRVGVSAIAGCGLSDCAPCAKGQSTWCPRKTFYPNVHAEEFLAGETGCLALPPDVPDEAGVLITGDGLGVPYHASLKLKSEAIGVVAVIGLGPIGLGNILMQSYLGRRVIAVGYPAQRLELARKMGAESGIDAKDADVVEALKEATGGVGVDACIEAAGKPEAVRQAFRCVRPGGIAVLTGEQASVELSPSEDFIRRDITAVGSWFYQTGEFEAMLQLWRDGFPVQALISHILPFGQAVQALELADRGAAGKILLRY